MHGVNTLDYILNKFNIAIRAGQPPLEASGGQPPTKAFEDRRMPIEIPNFGREDLAGLLGELGFGFGAEIGVETGEYSETLCRRNPGLQLYCVDAWRAYSGYREHVSQEKLDAFYETAKARLEPLGCTLIRKFSMEAVKGFMPHTLDFVYIDANHEYRHVVEDISEWIKRIRPGGIIAGHDYMKRVGSGYQVHVVEAVQGYTTAYHIRPWFVLGSKDVREGETRDRPRSWMWVKE
jgi:hypothetical protein